MCKEGGSRVSLGKSAIDNISDREEDEEQESCERDKSTAVMGLFAKLVDAFSSIRSVVIETRGVFCCCSCCK